MPRTAQGSLRSLIAGTDPTRPPVMLWKHFYLDEPRKLADATVAFYREHHLAAAKIMPDIPLLFADGALASWTQVAQLRRITALGRADEYVATVRHTREQLEPEDVLLVTVFSPLALLGMWCGPDVFTELVGAPAAGVHAVLSELAEGTARLLGECAAAGADGVYYSCWGQDVLGVDSYREFGIPYDLAGLQGAGPLEMRLVHVHGGKGTDLSTYAGYPVNAVGWSELETGIALVDGARTLPGKIPMGGITERPPAAAPDAQSTTLAHLNDIAHTLGSRFIAAPGCSLPDDLDEAGLAALRDAASSCAQ